jgi:outer membrane protein assembly factor BamB
MGYASPILMTLGGERHVVVCGRPYVYGLRVEDGAERWKFLWHIIDNERPITQPAVLGTNRLFLSAAYLTGCTAFEINRTNSEYETRALWRTRGLKTKFASVVVWQGYIYGFDEDILVCLDAQTGERKWKDGRYGYGQVLLASGYLIVQCANGDLALLKATPDAWTEVARFPALNGKSWNVPAISNDRLMVRNGAEMACFDLTPAK